MKSIRFILGTFLLVLCAGSVSAEEYIFDRLAVGVEVGTAGAGFEIASPVTRFVTLRAGVSAIPQVKVREFTLPYSIRNVQYSTNIEAKVNKLDGKLLADIYPFEKSGFHLTTGLYIGSPDLILLQNTAPLQGISKGEGIMVGSKFITPDDGGIVHINARTASMKPYVGIGFGRPCSDSHLNLALDLGVQYWGKPTLNAWSPDEEAWAELTPDDVNNDDFKKIYDIVQSIPVYPVLNLRLYYCF